LSTCLASHDAAGFAFVEQQVWTAARVPGDENRALFVEEETTDFWIWPAFALDLQQQGSHDAGTAVRPTIEIHTKIASERLSMATRSRKQDRLINKITDIFPNVKKADKF